MAEKQQKPGQTTGAPVSSNSAKTDNSARRKPCAAAGVPVPSLETVQSALFYLMSRYARTGCINLLQPIVDHLQILDAHPDSGPPESTLRRAYRHLAAEWSELHFLRYADPPADGSGKALH